MSNDDTKQQITALAAFPSALRAQLKGLDDGALRFRPAPGAWSAVEVVGHLVEIEALWSGRIRQMLATEHPIFPSYDPDAVVQARDYQRKQVGALLALFEERRVEHLEFLRVLRPAQLARTGRHSYRGDLSVADALAILAGHDQNHAQQIAANIEQMQG